MISFRCDHCGTEFEVKVERPGRSGQCLACGKTISIPASNEHLAVAGSDHGVRSTTPRPGEEKQQDATPRPPPSEAVTHVRSVGKSAPGVGLTTSGQTVSYTPINTVQREAVQVPPRQFVEFLAPPEKPDEIGRLGSFRVLNVLGAGGMGVVYKAEDPQLKRLVALKVMLPSLGASESARQRFLLEARAAATIVHEHVVPILQVGEDRGVPFIVMQYLEGEPLDRRLIREGRLPVCEVFRIGREIAEGLAAAHEKGLVHRDIKPANLWLEGKRGRVKILDFGLARGAGEGMNLTQSGAVLGTPAFMAPEQAEGIPTDYRCDLFSLGCVLYCLCTGQLPFKGDSTLAIIRALALTDPEPPRTLTEDVPLPLSDLVMRLLAKDPKERPQSAQAVAETLQELETQAGELAREQGTRKGKTAHAVKKRPRRVWLVAGGSLCVGLLGVVFLLLRSGGHQAPPGDISTDVRQPEAPARKFKNSLGMEFVLVPKGRSWLGGGGGKVGDKEVEIKVDFYLGTHEITQEEWKKVTGKAPSTFKALPGVGKENFKRFPVESVSWDDAQGFIKQLNTLTNEPGWVYRLPKSAEWEYSCRGGPCADKFDSSYDFYFEKPTNQLLLEQANFMPAPGKGLGRARMVGGYQPNPLGLYDMHGNVWEWCDDSEKAADGAVNRVLRGGCLLSGSGSCRAAHHLTAPPSYRFLNLGVRLARVPVGKQ